MPKSYRPWSPDDPYLLPPDPRAWLPEGHLAHFVLEVVEKLDISAIADAIQAKDPRGERPFAPRMMLALLVYGYCTGVFSSRKIERKTHEDVAFRYLAGSQHPHFSTICEFRRVHLDAIAALFVQIVQISRRAGLAKLGHVSLDGSKVQANASKHKAMSYDRMVEEEKRLGAEIEALLARGEQQDKADDARLGEGVAETDIPAEIHRREARLARIEAARAALEEEARLARAAQLREQAERARSAAAQAENERERAIALARAERRDEAARAVEPAGTAAEPADGDEASNEGEESPSDGEFPEHAPRVTPEGLPKPDAQRNFTDPDSRIMARGGEIMQAYNGQIAVDGESQIIVAQGLSNQAPDTYYLVPMLERVQSTAGALPEKITADAGFWAPANATWCEEQKVDAYIATQRHRRSAVPEPAAGPAEPRITPQQKMRAKVASPEGQKIYRRRKCIPEPVFGQIKQAMGFRRFSMRGMDRAKGEWALVCSCHNVRKLWVARRAERLAAIV